VTEIGSEVSRFSFGDRVVAAQIPDWVSGRFSREVMASALGWAADACWQSISPATRSGFVAIRMAVVRGGRNASLRSADRVECAVRARRSQAWANRARTGLGGVSTFALQFALAAVRESSPRAADRVNFEHSRSSEHQMDAVVQLRLELRSCRSWR